MVFILSERPQDAAEIEHLHGLSFGTGRFRKTVYRLRAGRSPVPGLNFVATAADGASPQGGYGPGTSLCGAIRFWPVLVTLPPGGAIAPEKGLDAQKPDAATAEPAKNVTTPTIGPTIGETGWGQPGRLPADFFGTFPSDALPAVLLGPLAVHPAWQRRGLGAQLVEAGLAAVQDQGWPACLLVGDPDFYGRFGFEAAAHRLALPGPVAAERLLLRVFSPSAFPLPVPSDEARACVEGWPVLARVAPKVGATL